MRESPFSRLCVHGWSFHPARPPGGCVMSRVRSPVTGAFYSARKKSGQGCPACTSKPEPAFPQPCSDDSFAMSTHLPCATKALLLAAEHLE